VNWLFKIRKVNMEERIELDPHDVLYMLEKDGRFLSQPTIKVLEIGNCIAHQHGIFNNWKRNGFRCEVLQQGGQWVAGRAYVRATIDFVPDEDIPEVEEVEIKQLMESPLDDLRQKLMDGEV
jgi:hypothetical protein